MQNLLFIVLSLIITPISMASVFECESNFLHPSVFEANDNAIPLRKEIDQQMKSFKNLKDDYEKNLVLDDMYRKLYDIHSSHVEEFGLIADDMVEEFDAEIIKSLQDQISTLIIKEDRKRMNFIINRAKELMDEKGIATQVRFRKVANGVQYKYLEIDFNKMSKNSKAYEEIKRYKKKFGLKKITFDLYENIIHHSAGFSMQTAKRIDLGMAGIKNLSLDDLITMVGKHEFKHAGFAQQRRLGKSSIYDSAYVSANETPLSKASSGYDYYMNAEELYNFTNNPYWASTRLQNIKNYDAKSITQDLRQISYYIQSTMKIAKQAQSLTDDFIKLLNNKVKSSQVSFNFLTERYSYPRSFEDVKYLQIVDKNKQNVLLFHMAEVDPKVIKKMYEIEAKIMTDNTELINTLVKQKDDKAINKLEQKIQNQKFKMAQQEYENVFKLIVKKQKSLNKVAKEIQPINQEVIDYQTTLLENFEEFLLKNPKKDFRNDDFWVEQFKKLREKYRKLGVVVREDYKDFLGK